MKRIKKIMVKIGKSVKDYFCEDLWGLFEIMLGILLIFALIACVAHMGRMATAERDKADQQQTASHIHK
jgi:hypothetical protein